MHSNTDKVSLHRWRIDSVNAVLCINIALSAALIVLVAWLFNPVFEWAWNQLTREDRQYHLLVSTMFVALCVFRLHQEKRSLHFANRNAFATSLLCVVCIAFVLNQQYLRLNALSVALFLMFCFALLGHFVSMATWRSCLQPLLLAVLVLPFEGYLDIFLGFPMRLLSAEVAANVLHGLNIATISSDTVLLIDNQAAIVDIDCSGIKGFWIGGVFFCAITWIERYQLNLRWLFIACLAAFLLFAGNVLRIVALVVLDLVLGRAELAQLLHESLGLISFTAVLFLSWHLLRVYGTRHKPLRQSAKTPFGPAHHTIGVSKTTLMLCLLLSGFVLLPTSEVDSAHVNTEPAWHSNFANNQFTPQPLNPIEKKFFVDNGANAFKFSGIVRSGSNEYQASVLVVFSRNWKSQHIPEHCYVAQGYDITSSQVLKPGESVEPDEASYRELQLVKHIVDSETQQSYTSNYWFQSNNQTTVNYSRRIFSQLANRDKPWALVSVLWRDGVPHQVKEQFLMDIRNSVSRNMENHG